MDVIIVDNTSLKSLTLKSTREFTLERKLMDVIIVENTLEKNPMDVISVDNTSLKCQTLKHTRKSTLDRNPRCEWKSFQLLI